MRERFSQSVLTIALLPLLVALGVLSDGGTPSSPEFPFLARFYNQNATLHSYTAPVHVAVTIHELLTFHTRRSGTLYFGCPDKLVLTMPSVPTRFRHTFSDMGVERTWPLQYALTLRSSSISDGKTVHHLQGTPRAVSTIDHMLVDITDDPGDPVRVKWFLRGGGTIDMAIENGTIGPYELPTQEIADIRLGHIKIHAVFDLGPYRLNETFVNETLSPGHDHLSFGNKEDLP